MALKFSSSIQEIFVEMRQGVFMMKMESVLIIVMIGTILKFLD